MQGGKGEQGRAETGSAPRSSNYTRTLRPGESHIGHFEHFLDEV